MGLLQKLIKTYDVMADKYAGVYIDGMREPLAPVSHALQNAQIEITIDSNGCFIDAAAVPKKENRTLIPVSLKSANRTSHASPHPFAEQLEYLSGFDEERQKSYLEQLMDWDESAYFVVKHLLEATDNQELNDFMGKDTDEAVLYNETDIRGVIAQMPELVFYEYYYKFKSIYDKQGPNSDSGFEPKKNPVYKWIIGISNSEADGVSLYNYEGTVEQIKNRLISLIKEDRENDKSGWDYGSENENEISDESDGDKKVFSGFGCYSEYHINYTAEMLTEIEKLSD